MNGHRQADPACPKSADFVAKVPKCRATNFPRKDEQAAIADRCSLKRAPQVACECVAGCSSPPHQYSIAAPTAREILDRWCKKTFATKSATNGLMRRSK